VCYNVLNDYFILIAGELAYSILQRAGEDLAKYGGMIPSKKNKDIVMDGINNYS